MILCVCAVIIVADWSQDGIGKWKRSVGWCLKSDSLFTPPHFEFGTPQNWPLGYMPRVSP